MPKPSASSPPHRSRHSIANTSPRAVHDREVARRRRARGSAPVVETEPVRARLEPARGPARRPRSRAARRARAAPTASIRTSKPLRGTSRLTATTCGRSGSSPSVVRSRATVRVVVGGRNRSTSTPGGITTPAQAPSRGRAPLRAPDTRPPRRPRPRRAAPAAERRWLPGSRPGTVISAPCSTTTLRRRRAAAAPSRPERQHRVEEDHVGADLARQRVDATREHRRRQQHLLAHAARPGTPAPRPTPRRRRTAS